VSLLYRSSSRYILRHPWQSFLSILGIAIGVAVAVSIDLANQSARAAFSISMERVAGKATHHIVGGFAGFSDSLFRSLRVEYGIRNCAPVAEGFVKLEPDPSRTFTLLGVDPFAELPFRSFLSGNEDLQAFLIQPAAVFLLRETAESLGVEKGDSVRMLINGVPKPVHLAGYLIPEDEEGHLGYEDIIVADISSAQELLGKPGRLSHIDLIIPDTSEGSEYLERIERHLPPGLSIIRSESRSRSAEQMVSAFNLNLTAMSLLALIVGMFLIYNTMTFSVMRRRVHLGLLRSMGTTRGEIFRIVLAEALWLGGMGAAAGVGLGILMAHGLVDMISRTINDLYFVVTVRQLEFTPFILGKGLVLGLGASILASFSPAREAMRSPPVSMLKRSLQETNFREKILLISAAGVLAILAGILILFLPPRSVVLGYTGILFLILGFAWLTPLVLLFIARFVNLPMRVLFGLVGSMVARGLRGQMSRVSVAVAALGLAVAATVGVATTVSSFRSTVVDWLERRLEADVYISAPGSVSRLNDADLPEGLVEKIPNLSGFRGMNFFRESQVRLNDRIVIISGASIEPHSRSRYAFKEGVPESIWQALDRDGAVIVSEPFAFQNEVKVGDTLILPTDKGKANFPVAGIYYDYGSDLGVVTMKHETYTRWWNDSGLSGIAVYVEEGTDIEDFMNQVRSLTNADLQVRTNRMLREKSIEIFDRTFMIANVLQFLAVAVAFIGVLSALMAIQLERSRELAILCAIGFTPRQTGFLVILQSALAGACAGILSLPLGSVLAWTLIYIINQRSFGWTLRFETNTSVFLEAVLLAFAAALVAGLYPALKLSARSPAAALREE
jgi:putative ABC transport system permease protein